MVQETRLMPSSTWSPMPPTVLLRRRERSGLHRAKRSGLGFPTRFFVPSVIKKATARDSPRPIQPAFHSHSLRFQSFVLEAGLPEVGPTPMTSETIKIMTAGITRPMTTRRPVEIFSLET